MKADGLGYLLPVSSDPEAQYTYTGHQKTEEYERMRLHLQISRKCAAPFQSFNLDFRRINFRYFYL